MLSCEQIWEGLGWSGLLILLFAIPVSKFLLVVVYELFKQLVPPTDIVARYCRKDEETWAVVTGATDGIGLGFCEVLVEHGFNIVLISRNPQKLATTVTDLQKRREASKKQGKLKTIAFNFKDSGDATKYNEMIEQIKGLDVGLLVNNVGTSDAGLLHKFQYQKIVDLININCTSMAVLSADILAIMNKRSQKSAVINLSSYMQDRPLPYFAMYTATKAFNRNFTESISLQYPNIDVMCLKPLFVQTPLSKAKKGFTVPDPRECVRDSLRQLRWEHESYGYVSHRIIGAISQHLIPEWLVRKLVEKFGRGIIKKAFPKSKID